MGSTAILALGVSLQSGKARAKALTPERRKEIATKASKAAAKARARKAKKKTLSEE